MKLNKLVFYPGLIHTSGKIDAFVQELNSKEIFAEVEFYPKTNLFGCLGKIISGTGTITFTSKTLNMHFDRKKLHIIFDELVIATLFSNYEGDLFKSTTTYLSIESPTNFHQPRIIFKKPDMVFGTDGLRLSINDKIISMPLSRGSRPHDFILDGFLEAEFQEISNYILAVSFFYRMIVHQFSY